MYPVKRVHPFFEKKILEQRRQIMKVIRAKSAGFCFGVRRAVETV